jgi:preprotein translocase subunit YajC
VDLLIPLALAALLIFFLFNSRRKQKARAEQIKSNLAPGATVMTTFGVFGTVLSIDEENNQVTIESGPGTVLRVHRQAIGQVENPEAAASVDAPAADAADDADKTAASENEDEKPAITDAELDAMNARKRAEGDDAADAKSTDASDEAADSADDVAESTDDAESSEVKDESETDSDADDSDSDESDTDKKN